MISPEILRRFPLFAGLEFETLKTLAMIGDQLQVKEGEWVFHENEPANYFYLILHGSVELLVTLNEQAARYSELETLGEGEFVGWSAVIEPYCYKLGARALVDSTLVSIDATALRTLLREQPAAEGQLMYRLAQGIGSRLNNMRVRFVSLIEE